MSSFKNFFKPSKKDIALKAMKLIKKEGDKTFGMEEVFLKIIINHEGKRGFAFYSKGEMVSDVIIVDDLEVVDIIADKIGMKRAKE